MTGGVDGEWLQQEKAHPYALWFRWRDVGQRSSNSANIKVCEEKKPQGCGKKEDETRKSKKDVESVKKIEGGRE